MRSLRNLEIDALIQQLRTAAERLAKLEVSVDELTKTTKELVERERERENKNESKRA